MTDPTPPTQHASSTPPAADADTPARRLLTGDRLCGRCGHNLVNQPISREPAYGLLVARCPECGDAAPLQEYPLLGRWAGRLAALGAVAWMLVLLGIIGGTGITLFSGAMMAWSPWQGRAAATLDELYAADTPGVEAGPGGSGFTFNDTFNPTTDFAAWFVNADRAVLHRRIVEADDAVWSVPGAALAALMIAPLVVAAGILLAVLLLHRRAIGAALIGTMTSLAVGLLLLWWMMWLIDRDAVTWSYDASTLIVGWRVVLTGIIYNAVVLAFSILYGRAMARGLVRLAVPPRLRGSLAFLWLADDRPLPPGVTRNRGPRVH